MKKEQPGFQLMVIGIALHPEDLIGRYDEYVEQAIDAYGCDLIFKGYEKSATSRSRLYWYGSNDYTNLIKVLTSVSQMGITVRRTLHSEITELGSVNLNLIIDHLMQDGVEKPEQHPDCICLDDFIACVECPIHGRGDDQTPSIEHGIPGRVE
jgi:hypothetical protein